MDEKKDGILWFFFEEGLRRTIINADALIEASKTLQQSGHYPYSIYLAYQGIEEYGKAFLFLKEISQNKKEISPSRWERVYRDHPRKIREARRAINEKYYGLKEFTVTDYDSGEILSSEQTLEFLIDLAVKEKERNIYVDWDFKAYHWRSPLKIFSPEWAKKGSASVLVMAHNARRALEIVLEEMELSHLGDKLPVN